jgi:hypothetical protein
MRKYLLSLLGVLFCSALGLQPAHAIAFYTGSADLTLTIVDITSSDGSALPETLIRTQYSGGPGFGVENTSGTATATATWSTNHFEDFLGIGDTVELFAGVSGTAASPPVSSSDASQYIGADIFFDRGDDPTASYTIEFMVEYLLQTDGSGVDPLGENGGSYVDLIMYAHDADPAVFLHRQTNPEVEPIISDALSFSITVDPTLEHDIDILLHAYGSALSDLPAQAPEPATLPLMAIGLAGIGFARKNKE